MRPCEKFLGGVVTLLSLHQACMSRDAARSCASALSFCVAPSKKHQSVHSTLPTTSRNTPRWRLCMRSQRTRDLCQPAITTQGDRSTADVCAKYASCVTGCCRHFAVAEKSPYDSVLSALLKQTTAAQSSQTLVEVGDDAKKNHLIAGLGISLPARPDGPPSSCNVLSGPESAHPCQRLV